MPKMFGECFGWLRLGSIHADMTINGRSFRVIRKLGEGGYAIVYLVKDLNSPTVHSSATDVFAVKKVFTNTDENLALMKAEIQMLKQLRHPNLVELLDAKVVTENTPSASTIHSAYMLFPAYEDGTLAQEVERLHAISIQLPTSEVLSIFHQMCLGVQYMHDKGYAHRDLKPHNALIVKQHRHNPNDPPADPEAPAAPFSSYKVLIMDFGSARPIPIRVTNRLQALAAQEDADANCTATYRAPELFDVASQCVLDGKVDVWALGCTLYALMYGVSPFQKALDKGDSLALAVLECVVPFPEGKLYPEALHELVMACLVVNPEERLTMREVVGRVEKLQKLALPDPQVRSRGAGGGGSGS